MLRSVLVALAVAALATAPAYAGQQIFDESQSGQISFVMPSGNIGCLYTPEAGTDVYQPADGGPELICERVAPSYRTVILTPWDEPTVIKNPDEQSCCGGDNVFQYGNSVELDGFVCTSKTSGLRCETEDGEHGFWMARAGITVY